MSRNDDIALRSSDGNVSRSSLQSIRGEDGRRRAAAFGGSLLRPEQAEGDVRRRTVLFRETAGGRLSGLAPERGPGTTAEVEKGSGPAETLRPGECPSVRRAGG
jgi:hypothetical protein